MKARGPPARSRRRCRGARRRSRPPRTAPRPRRTARRTTGGPIGEPDEGGLGALTEVLPRPSLASSALRPPPAPKLHADRLRVPRRLALPSRQCNNLPMKGIPARWPRSTPSASASCSARFWCWPASCRASLRCASGHRCCSSSSWSACWPARPGRSASSSTTCRSPIRWARSRSASFFSTAACAPASRPSAT